MKKYMSILFITILLAGCGSIATQYRKDGRHLTNKGFNYLDKEPRLNKTIILKNLEIHIVGDRKHFDIEKYKNPKAEGYKKGVIGYAYRRKDGTNVIYIRGTMKNDKIILDLSNLGHEMGHILRFHERHVLDPHSYDDWGV